MIKRRAPKIKAKAKPPAKPARKIKPVPKPKRVVKLDRSVCPVEQVAPLPLPSRVVPCSEVAVVEGSAPVRRRACSICRQSGHKAPRCPGLASGSSPTVEGAKEEAAAPGRLIVSAHVGSFKLEPGAVQEVVVDGGAPYVHQVRGPRARRDLIKTRTHVIAQRTIARIGRDRIAGALELAQELAALARAAPSDPDPSRSIKSVEREPVPRASF